MISFGTRKWDEKEVENKIQKSDKSAFSNFSL